MENLLLAASLDIDAGSASILFFILYKRTITGFELRVKRLPFCMSLEIK